MRFDPESFVADCRVASVDDDPVSAIRDVVAAAIVDGGAIDQALGSELKQPDTLFASPDLTVQRILWPPGLSSLPHDHRMTAVIGVYAGEEVNWLYERTAGGLEERERRIVGATEVLVLDAEEVHSVETFRGSTAGLHVYCGDILSIERSAWGPDGREVPFAENAEAMRAMFRVIPDVAGKEGVVLDEETRYRANVALRSWCGREQRYPTPSEAQAVVIESWARGS